MADDSKDEEVVKEVEAEEQPLEQGEFIKRLREKRKEKVVEGCRIRALSGTDQARLKGMRYGIGAEVQGADRVEQYVLRENAAWLALGVVEPAMDFGRWLFEMDEGHGGILEHIIDEIKSLSGAVSMELELAKKALGQLGMGEGL